MTAPCWANRYVGIRFACDGRDFDGCDCWGLVCIVYRKELSITLPEYCGALTDFTIASARRVAAAIDFESRRWKKVSTPVPYDVVLFRRGRVPGHVGIVVDAVDMLHIEHGIDSVCEPYDGALWHNKLMGFYRYAN